jgi:3-methyladenine DNA glycosylase Mpg
MNNITHNQSKLKIVQKSKAIKDSNVGNIDYSNIIKKRAKKYPKLFGAYKDKFNINYELINYDTIETIAKSLLLKYVLMVNDKEYRICEIEFYINSTQHPDQYTHSDDDQKSFGKWYFHKCSGGSYKGGTYKGMDITMGNNETYFGILIRSIYDENLCEMIEGPCRSVNKILELNNCYDVKEYMANKCDPLSVRNTRNVYLKWKSSDNDEPIYKGPRIGLSDKYPEWQNVPYRFLIKKNLIKKGKSTLVLL